MPSRVQAVTVLMRRDDTPATGHWSAGIIPLYFFYSLSVSPQCSSNEYLFYSALQEEKVG